jgi:hypothetical protein
MKKLGVNLKDSATGGFRKFADILDDIDVGFKKFNAFQQTTISKRLFKAQSLLPSFALVGARKNIREYEQALLSAAGTTKEQAAIMRKELSVQFAILGSTFEGFIDKMTVKLAPSISDATQGLIKLFSVLTDEGALGTFKKLFSADFEFFDSVVVKSTAGVVGLVAALGTLKLVLKAINIVAKSNPFILAFTVILGVTGTILGNLEKIKELLGTVKEHIPFTGEVAQNQTLDFFDRHNLGQRLARARAEEREQRAANQRVRQVIELPQNSQKIAPSPQATLDVNFNNMPSNAEVKSTSQNMGINVATSGGF